MKRIIALLMCVVLALGAVGCSSQPENGEEAGRVTEVKQGSFKALSTAVYPKMAVRPSEEDYFDARGNYDNDRYTKLWDAYRLSQEEIYAGTDDARIAADFYIRTVRTLLSEAGKDNLVYSPVNVYMALAMLAEVTDNNSRAQILKVLGEKNITSLRVSADQIWRANYSDDGLLTTTLGSSIWLRDDYQYKEEAFKTLADKYFASAYSGTMGSQIYDDAMHAWIDEQTGGLLKDQSSQLHFSVDTILALCSTIYFKAKWTSEFNDWENEERIFHSPDKDVVKYFMQQTERGILYIGNGWRAVTKHFEDGADMYYILPDEGVSMESLLEKDDVLEFISDPAHFMGRTTNSRIHLVVPKFDVSSDTDLLGAFVKLGITDVLSPAMADFSPITDDTDISLSVAKHAARVKIDEEGCEAAAYTILMMNKTAFMPDQDEIVEFVLDRPFIFAITGRTGMTLFTGIVNNP